MSTSEKLLPQAGGLDLFVGLLLVDADFQGLVHLQMEDRNAQTCELATLTPRLRRTRRHWVIAVIDILNYCRRTVAATLLNSQWDRLLAAATCDRYHWLLWLMPAPFKFKWTDLVEMGVCLAGCEWTGGMLDFNRYRGIRCLWVRKE